MLDELPVGSPLIGDQTAEQGATGSARNLLIARPTGARGERKARQAAERSAADGVLVLRDLKIS